MQRTNSLPARVTSLAPHTLTPTHQTVHHTLWKFSSTPDSRRCWKDCAPGGVGLVFLVLFECVMRKSFLLTTYWSENHFIIVMIRWTGLAPWEFEFPIPGSLASNEEAFQGQARIPTLEHLSLNEEVDVERLEVGSGGWVHLRLLSLRTCSV